MEQTDRRIVGKCFGSTVLGPRGQLVIPVEARRELGIDVGTKLLAFSHFDGKGLMLVKVDAVEDLLNQVNLTVNEFAKVLKERENVDVERRNEGD